MRQPLHSLFVLHADAAFRERVRRAAQGRFRLHFVHDWEALPPAIEAAGHLGIVVIDPYYGRGRDEGVALEAKGILDAYPTATVVAALHTRPGWFNDVRQLGEWGVAEVIDLGVESTHIALQQRLHRLRSRPLRTLLERGVILELPSRGYAILDAAVETVSAGQHTQDLARALGVSRDTLTRWCRRAGLPVPRRLLLWMRILLAAELLDDPALSVLDAAFACGYSSDDAFRRALQGVLGAGPQALRQQGAFRVASAAFLKEVEDVGRERAGRAARGGPS